MANEIPRDDTNDPSDANESSAEVVSASPSTPESASEPASDREVPLEATSDSMTLNPDPADEIPVPVAMSPAEIDERAQAVEAVRGKVDPETGVASG